MTKQEAVRLAVMALHSQKGDDWYRAQQAFGNFNEREMQQQHGESGKTRQQILNEYAAHDRRINDAVAIIETL